MTQKRAVLVIGGAGFVGANLVRQLVKNEENVFVIIRTGGSDLWRIKDVLGKIKLFEGILTNRAELTKLIKKINPANIYHLATYGAYPSQGNLNHMIKTNVLGTLNLLFALEKINYKKLVITGSSSEYGVKEKSMSEADVLEPNNFYAAAKASQTHFSLAFAQAFRKPVLILRLFNVYGPFEEKGRLVRSVIESALSEKPILLATGKEARDLIFVDDVVDALIRAANSDLNGQIFNIGTGVQTSILQLARKVVKFTKSKSEILVGAYPGRPTDSFNWVADIRKTKKFLGWQSKYNLDKGLIKTINWYRKSGKKND